MSSEAHCAPPAWPGQEELASEENGNSGIAWKIKPSVMTITNVVQITEAGFQRPLRWANTARYRSTRSNHKGELRM